MAIWRRLGSWLSWFPWYRRQAREADLERELRDYLDLEVEEQRAAGLSPEQAAYAAHRALGNTLKIEEGVRAAGGLTIGILPGSDARDANAYIDVPLATGMGEMRNALIVRVAGAIVAIGGGSGTLSEIALALRIGTPVVGLHDNFAGLAALPRVADAAAAADWALARAG